VAHDQLTKGDVGISITSSPYVNFQTNADWLHLVVDAVTDCAIYMLDPGGHVLSWNSGAERLKGYTANQIIGQSFLRFFTLEDQQSNLPRRILDNAARHGRFEDEGWRVRKDGTKFWALAVTHKVQSQTGQHIGFVKVTRDITERKNAEAALLESERRFRILVQGVTDYALYMLDPNGVVTSWNVGAERIKGYTESEIIGQHFSRFYTAEDRARGLPAHALQTAKNEGRFEAEGWRVRKDGSLFLANVVVDPILDNQGNLVGYSKITRDITQRWNAQRALQESQVRIAQMQKMEALGQLTGGVAHDFNNLLMVVIGNLSRLTKLAADDARASKAIEAIEASAQHGASLTRQLLSFARRQSLRPGVTEIAALLEDARPILTSLVGAAIHYTTAISPDTWPIFTDASELRFAIINLAVNARDAMGQGGTIAVIAENVILCPDDHGLGLDGEFVAITISDTGHGIPPDVLAKVFDPFFTTKPADKGTGLGLSQVHGFVHQSGGGIHITSAIGQGTRVTLYLPRAASDCMIEGPRTAVGESAAGRRVLVVEDNPDVGQAVEELLVQMGCRFERAHDAATALEMLADSHFDTVLSDIVMSGSMNGLDLARAIRRLQPALSIVLVTGYSEVALEAAQEFTVLRKPYGGEDLTRVFSPSIPLGSPPSGHAHIVDFRGVELPKRRCNT